MMLCSLNEITSQFRKACRGAGFPAGHGDELALAAAWLVSRDLDGTAALLKGLAAGFDPSFPPLEKSQDAGGAVSFAAETIKVASHGPGLRDLMLASGGTTECEVGSADSPLLLFGLLGQVSAVHGCRWVWSPMPAGHTQSLVLEHGTICGNPDRSAKNPDNPASPVHLHLTLPAAEPVPANTVLFTPDFPSGFTVNEELWPQINKLAAKTYVPASEASRITGAGAAINDND